MTGKQMADDRFTSNLAGMSMSQLYDIMSQMKILIEQNQEQARQILVDSPGMTRSLFQAQILLGMVQTPQVMPSIQQALSQAPQQSVQPVQPSTGQANPLPVQVGQQEASQIQIQIPARKQLPNHPVSSVPSADVLPVTHQSQTSPSYSQQSMHPAKEHTSTHGTSISHPQSSQIHTMNTHQSQSMPSYSQQSMQPSKEHTSTDGTSISHPQSSQQSMHPAKEHTSTHGTSISHPQSSQIHTMNIHQSQSMPSYSQQSMQPSKEHTSTDGTSISHPQSSQVRTVSTHQSQTMPSHSQQSMQPSKEHTSTQGTSITHPQSSQVHTMPPHQFQSVQQPPSFHQTQKPNMSSQSQQSLYSPGAHHHSLQPPLPSQPRPPSMQPPLPSQPRPPSMQPPLPSQPRPPSMQPPLPSQPRPPSMQPFQHQHRSQMGPHVGFQTSAPSQSHISQQQFIPIPNQPPLQSLYQGGSQISVNFNDQGGGSNMQMERPSWMPGPPENSTVRSQLPGPPPLPGQMGPGSQTPRPPQLTNEMEKTLLHQVMSLTPEQINLLPPEQRHQVFQLQQMLR